MSWRNKSGQRIQWNSGVSLIVPHLSDLSISCPARSLSTSRAFGNAPAVYIFSQYIRTPEYFKEKVLPRDFWPSPIWSGCCVGSLTATILECPFTMNLWVLFASLMFDLHFQLYWHWLVHRRPMIPNVNYHPHVLLFDFNCKSFSGTLISFLCL